MLGRMRILVVQHDLEAPLGALGPPLRARGEITSLLGRAGTLPATVDGYDLVVVLGAVDSVLDQPDEGWYRAEQALLRDADARGVPILGVCFGAQVLADTFGGSVQVLPTPEVGWTTVHTERPDLIPEGPWLNFHTDGVTPPPSATVLATSDACVQAFVLGPHLAVQFHPEVHADQVAYWTDWLRSSLVAAAADGDAIVAEARLLEADNEARCTALVEAFLDGKHTA